MTDRLTEIKARVASYRKAADPYSTVGWLFDDLEFCLAEIERLTLAINEAASMGLGYEWLAKWLPAASAVQSLTAERDEWRKQAGIGIQSQFGEGLKYEKTIARLREELDALVIWAEASGCDCRSARAAFEESK